MPISVFKKINPFVNKSKILDAFAIFCAKYLLYLMVALLFIFAIIAGNWHLFFYPVLSGFFAAFFIDTIIYFFYKKDRPAELKKAKLLIAVPKNPSFPSRHASLSFGLSSFLFFYNIPLAIFFIICSCFVGIARVFSGVHWFKDILAGAVVGFVSTFIIHTLLGI